MKTTRFLITVPVEEKFALDNIAKSQNKKTAEYVRAIITNHLLQMGAISSQAAAHADAISAGGNSWTRKRQRATPEEQAKIDKQLSEHAKKMRAARTAKNSIHIVGNNSGVIIAGDNTIIDKPHPK